MMGEMSISWVWFSLWFDDSPSSTNGLYQIQIKPFQNQFQRNEWKPKSGFTANLKWIISMVELVWQLTIARCDRRYLNTHCVLEENCCENQSNVEKEISFPSVERRVSDNDICDYRYVILKSHTVHSDQQQPSNTHSSLKRCKYRGQGSEPLKRAFAFDQ